VEEVQRWIAEQTEPALGSSDSPMAEPLNHYLNQQRLSLPHHLAAAMTPRPGNPEERSTMAALDGLASFSSQDTDFMSYDPSRRQAEQLLIDLEARAVEWARQASRMREE
jgi:hypothetical protein